MEMIAVDTRAYHVVLSLRNMMPDSIQTCLRGDEHVAVAHGHNYPPSPTTHNLPRSVLLTASTATCT